MSELEMRQGGWRGLVSQALEAEITGQPMIPRDIVRTVNRAAAKQYGKGVVNQARVITTKGVTDLGMLFLEDIEAKEAAAVARDPMSGGRRQRRLVDAATDVFEDAIHATGRR